MKYTVRKATLDDIRALIPYSTEGGKITTETLNTTDDTRVFLYGDKPLMILGIEYWPGSDEVITAGLWGLFSKDANKHTKQLVRTCKDLIFDRVGFVYFALIDENKKKFVRFAEFFGFERTEMVERINEMVYRIYVKR